MALAKSHRLRTGRHSEQHACYLCTAKTHRREPFFADFSLGRLVVEALRQSDAMSFTDTWTFVVMPDHFHWLFQLTGEQELSEVMARVKSNSARNVNQARGRSGAIWQPGFHDHRVRREESLAAIARYVVRNPVRAGLVRSVRDYPLWDARWL